jgi:hypothetical protein
VFKVGVLSNLPLLAAEFLGVGIVSCISYLPFLQSVFHTTGLTVYDWLMLTSFGVVLLVADEIRKGILRARRRRAKVAAAADERPGVEADALAPPVMAVAPVAVPPTREA